MVREQKVRVNSVTAWSPFSVWCLHQRWVMDFSVPVPFWISLSLPPQCSAFQAGSVLRGLGESSGAAALRAAWAGASPGREAPLGKSTSAAKWIAKTIPVLMRLCKPGYGSQSLTSLFARSIPITSCSPGAFVLPAGTKKGLLQSNPRLHQKSSFSAYFLAK